QLRDPDALPAAALTGQPLPTWGAPASAPAPAADAAAAARPTQVALDAPLDGCLSAGLLPRLGAHLVNVLLGVIVLAPLAIAALLIVTQDGAGLLAQILAGIGVAL
ncbi:MAG: hypothetical protein Q4G40_04320, partial [Brachybacterium sp.]|nr:hypothetical protein [Brachybacterium sp.]